MKTDDPRLLALIEQVVALEKQYATFDTAQTITDEALMIYERAVEKQRELLRLQSKPDHVQQEKLLRMEKGLDTAQAAKKVARVERLTLEGEEAQAADRLSEAGAKYKEALRLQREINGGGADSKYKNYVSESKLEKYVVSLAAYPLHKEKEEALKKALAAMKEERWSDALAAYVAANDALEKINRDFSRTRYADTAESSRLLSEIDSLKAATLVTRVADQEKAGENAKSSGDHPAAIRAFQEAYNYQQEINREYPRSRFVSSARLDLLEVKLQTARSQPVANELEVLELAIREDLRRRRVVAAEQKLPQATALTAKLSADFPRSLYVDGALRIRLSYLALKSADLRRMQDEVYTRLLPLPGTEDRLLFANEVPQGLYFALMNNNPSRNPGRTMPVDSVNWKDASEFCTRLSWVLGLKVRMPSLDEFRVAVGAGDGEARSASNGGRPGATDTAKPNEAGYRDLLGNLGEWLDADEVSEKAMVAGGSYLDNPDALAKVPSELRSKVDRARHLGFRFVVENPR